MISQQFPNILTGYIYDYPGSTTEPIHCIHCGNTILTIKGRLVTWTTSAGMPYQTVRTGDTYLQHICHRCKFIHRILVQQVY
jgi:hypothetical protein